MIRHQQRRFKTLTNKWGSEEAVTMSFKMPTGKKLDSMLDKLSAKDIKEIRAQFELDVQKENQKERHWLID